MPFSTKLCHLQGILDSVLYHIKLTKAFILSPDFIITVQFGLCIKIVVLESVNVCVILMCYMTQLRTPLRWRSQAPKRI